MNDLEKKIYKILAIHTYDEYYNDPARELESKQVAEFFIEEIKEAMKLASGETFKNSKGEYMNKVFDIFFNTFLKEKYNLESQ